MVTNWFHIFIGLVVLVQISKPLKGKIKVHLSSRNERPRPSTEARKDMNKNENTSMSDSDSEFLISSIEAEPVKIKKKTKSYPKSGGEKNIAKSRNRGRDNVAHHRSEKLHKEQVKVTTSEPDDLYGFVKDTIHDKSNGAEELVPLVDNNAKENDEPDFNYYEKIVEYNTKSGNKPQKHDDLLLPNKHKLSSKEEDDLLLPNKHKLSSKEEEVPPVVNERDLDVPGDDGLILLNFTKMPPTTTVPLHTYSYKEWCKFQPNGYDCNGTGKIHAGFYYDITLRACTNYEFGNCLDNFNKFSTPRECAVACEDVAYHELSDKHKAQNLACHLQPDFGECNEYYPMFFYDVTRRMCRGFSYSGCGGNTNKFKTASECTSTCKEALSYEAFSF